MLLEKGPPLRLVGMTWGLLIISHFLPHNFWGYIGMMVLGLFILVIIRSSFQPIWNQYQLMGGFVTIQTSLFAGLVWIPNSWWLLRFICGFLIVTGFATMLKHIADINKISVSDKLP